MSAYMTRHREPLLCGPLDLQQPLDSFNPWYGNQTLSSTLSEAAKTDLTSWNLAHPVGCYTSTYPNSTISSLGSDVRGSYNTQNDGQSVYQKPDPLGPAAVALGYHNVGTANYGHQIPYHPPQKGQESNSASSRPANLRYHSANTLAGRGDCLSGRSTPSQRIVAPAMWQAGREHQAIPIQAAQSVIGTEFAHNVSSGTSFFPSGIQRSGALAQQGTFGDHVDGCGDHDFNSSFDLFRIHQDNAFLRDQNISSLSSARESSQEHSYLLTNAPNMETRPAFSTSTLRPASKEQSFYSDFQTIDDGYDQDTHAPSKSLKVKPELEPCPDPKAEPKQERKPRGKREQGWSMPERGKIHAGQKRKDRSVCISCKAQKRKVSRAVETNLI